MKAPVWVLLRLRNDGGIALVEMPFDIGVCKREV